VVIAFQEVCAFASKSAPRASHTRSKKNAKKKKKKIPNSKTKRGKERSNSEGKPFTVLLNTLAGISAIIRFPSPLAPSFLSPF
jgi:hypothetical protein